MVELDKESPHAATWQTAQTPPAANTTRQLDHIDARPVRSSRPRPQQKLNSAQADLVDASGLVRAAALLDVPPQTLSAAVQGAKTEALNRQKNEPPALGEHESDQVDTPLR